LAWEPDLPEAKQGVKQEQPGVFRPWSGRSTDGGVTVTVTMLPGAGAAAPAGASAAPGPDAASAAGPGMGGPGAQGLGPGPAPAALAQAGAGQAGGQQGSEPARGSRPGAEPLTSTERTHYCYLFREEGARRAQGW